MQQEHGASHEDSTDGFTSKYRIIESPEGFHIEGIDRHPVYVRLAPQKTAILVGSQLDQTRYTAYSLFAYRAILAHIVNILLEDWTGKPSPISHDWAGARRWAESRAARTLNRRIHPHWRRLHTLVPTDKLDVARAVFAATFQTYTFGCEAMPELYHYPFLVKDIVNYRAAAIACHYALTMISKIGANKESRMRKDADFVGFYERFFGEPSVQLIGNKYHYHFFQSEDPEHRAALVALLARNWQALYSQQAVPGKSMRRMLVRLPGKLPAKMLSQLHVVEPYLQRPVTDRVELLTLYWYSDMNTAATAWAAPFFSMAAREHILVALRHLSKHLHRAFGPTREDTRLLVYYILDYCQSVEPDKRPQQRMSGTLVGLLERSMAWHRDMQEQELERLLATYTGEEKTAVPPIPLPAREEITFLATVQDIYLEGKRMGHCIARYTEHALQGNDYLFHVRYGECEATVQVSCYGGVGQSYGPRNSTNAASTYGEKVLRKWGKQLTAQWGQSQPDPQFVSAEPQREEFPDGDLGELDVHPF